MKKELLISAKFNTQDFDKSVEGMQNKLKSLYTPTDNMRQQRRTENRMAAAGIENPRKPVTKDQYDQTVKKTRRDLDTYIRDEVKKQDKLTKVMDQRENKLDDLKKKKEEVSQNARADVDKQDKLNQMILRSQESQKGMRKQEIEAINKAKELSGEREETSGKISKKEKKIAELKEESKELPEGSPEAKKMDGKIARHEKDLSKLKGTHAQQDEAALKANKDALAIQDKLFQSENGLVRMKEMAAKQAQAVSKSAKEELDLKTKIARVEENNGRLKELQRQREAVIGQALDARRSVTPSSWKEIGENMKDRGIWNTMKDIPGAVKANPMGMVGGAMGSIGSLAIAGGGLYNTMQQSQAIGQQAKGSAIAGTLGQDTENIYNGRSAFEAQWMRERSQASGMAAEQAKGNKVSDSTKVFGGILGGIGAGAAYGATAGSVLPGAGTLAGGLLGGAIGGIGAGAGLMLGDRTRERMLGMLPGEFGAKHQDAYNSLIAQQQGADRAKNYEALKEQDPQKKAVLEKFEKDRQNDLNTQRSLGLNDQGLNSFKQQATSAGFMPEQAANMAQSIVGAGGSARMGRNATFGNQMERAGLTNTSSVLGTMSGSIQSPESTKRATISIMSEAFKIGLDNTDFAEENRRFTQSAANIIGRSGASNAEDQEKLVAKLGSFLGERTNKGVEAADNAYEREQQRGSQVGGRRGAIRFTEAMKNPILSQFGTGDLTELLAARPDQLQANSPFLRSYAIQAHTTPEKILEALQKGTDASRFLIPGRRKEATDIVGRLKQYASENKLSGSEFTERLNKMPGEQGALPENIVKDYGKLQRINQMEKSEGYNKFESEADVSGLIFGNGTYAGGKAPSKAAAQQALDQTGGRIGDKFQAANSEGADQARKAFMDLYSTIEQNISKTKELNTAAADAAASLNKIANTGRAELPRGSATNAEVLTPLIQPQANKPRGQ
jgi:hypothetical protein